MTLKIYNKKRNFAKTPEPKGAKATSSKSKAKSLFIIQKHAASHLHYDFRIELNGVLLSWAIPKGPSFDPSIKRLAVHVEDHPLAYGSFEGNIPAGEYGGGTVMLWDKGYWISEDQDAARAYKKGNLTFSLQAEKLKGKWKLIRIGQDDKNWLLIKSKDEFSKSQKQYNVTVEAPNSVVSGKNMNEIAGSDITSTQKLKKNSTRSLKNDLLIQKSSFPMPIFPQLATLVDVVPTGSDWIHEVKFDGYRLLCYKKGKEIRLYTRNKNDWTEKFPTLVAEINKLDIKNIILDGEVVVLDEQQHSDFQLLQNAIKENENQKFIYYIFDVLYYDQYSLYSVPLLKRKDILKNILPHNSTILRFSDHILGRGEELLTKTCHFGLEGIVSKKVDSLYQQKRTQDWLKIKCIKRQEFIIAAFTQPKNKREYFGALLLGSYKDNKLIYHGKVGTGFTHTSLQEIYQALIKLKTSNMPFDKKPPASANVTWLKPKLVAEIEFSEWTEDGLLRHPTFKGLRMDKAAENVIKEEAKKLTKKKEKATIKKTSWTITHPNKILYPEDGITKENIAEYYYAIQKNILPFIINRPLTLLRCPDNYTSCFYQKHNNLKAQDKLLSIPIMESKSEENGIYIHDEIGLLSLVQMNCLEIHIWGSHVNHIENPDMIVFDLDPADDVAWQHVVDAAFNIKNELAALKLKAFVKTTGGKGLHVVIPIQAEYNWDEIKLFAHTFVDYLVTKNPKKYIGKITKSARKGKIFIDYLRNQRGATFIAPYSTRARLHAPISVPVHWDELSKKKEDTFFTIKTLIKRLEAMKQDPWKDILLIKQKLNIRKLFS